MDSKTLNEKIADLENQPVAEEYDHGKPIFYIGWFWRVVDFDSPTHDFGVIPQGADRNDEPLVGFMKNNKWGYPYVTANEQEWATIKSLLIIAAESVTKEACDAANNAIQALAEKEDFSSWVSPY